MTPLEDGAIGHQGNAELVARGHDGRVGQANDLDGHSGGIGSSVSEFSG